MFFRRERPRVPTFSERLETLKSAGFSVAAQGSGARVSRGECAVDLAEASGGGYRIDERAGLLNGGEIASLVDGGFQKFFRAPSGKRRPATADQLMALHGFEEDLKEALGETSLYNSSLGTVSTFYQYDRLRDRDRGVPKRAWD